MQAVKNILKAVLGALLYEKLCFYYRHRYWPDFTHPKTHNERIVARKLFHELPDATRYADKIAVRDYVRERGCGAYLTKMYWAGDDVDSLDWQSLPPRFVVKGSHGCGNDFLLFVDDKGSVSEADVKDKMRIMLQKRYGAATHENFYANIPPRILIEERLTESHVSVPYDYKIYVFQGRVRCIHVDIARFGDHRRNFYDEHWRQLPIKLLLPSGDLARPRLLDEMIRVAERLGAGFDHMRVDLYCVNDERVVFGEMTMTHAAGRNRFTPYEADLWLGSLWEGEQVPYKG